MSIVKIALLGASGYTGAELIRLLSGRADVQIAALSAERYAGAPLESVWPHLRGLPLPPLQKIDAIDFSGLDFVFCALPHGTTQAVVAGLPQTVRIVDLSADFRLRDMATYEKWYGAPHRAPALQADAVYGLSEIFRKEIATARLVANPGCYPTAAQLPLIPLIEAGVISPDGLIVDAKSGASGAGRAEKQNLLLCEAGDNFSAYGVATHRHTPEIEQGLSAAAGRAVQATFTPHLVPMSRGIFETIYVTLQKGATAETLRAVWQEKYKDSPFIRLLPQGALPATKNVRGSNLCEIAVVDDRVPGRAIILSAIDNLVKGAAGQAVQNMNLMLGLPETTGLSFRPLYP